MKGKKIDLKGNFKPWRIKLRLKKDNLYLFTLLAISTIVFIIGYFSMAYMVKVSTNQFLEIQIESSKREAREFAELVSS